MQSSELRHLRSCKRNALSIFDFIDCVAAVAVRTLQRVVAPVSFFGEHFPAEVAKVGLFEAERGETSHELAAVVELAVASTLWALDDFSRA